MTGDREPIPQSPGDAANPERAAAIAGNVAMLGRMSSVLEHHSPGSKVVEGCLCNEAPVILYVDRATGSIGGIGSVAAIKRALREMPGVAEQDAVAVEEAVTGLPGELLRSPNTARVHVWRQSAHYEPVSDSDMEMQAVRPRSWPRNDRVVPNEARLRKDPLEVLIPGDVQRGIFSESIIAYNNTPQSDIVRP